VLIALIFSEIVLNVNNFCVPVLSTAAVRRVNKRQKFTKSQRRREL